MSAAQLALTRVYLVSAYERGCRCFAHGCCTGADEEAALIAHELGYWLHGFPARPIPHPLRARTPDSIIEPIPHGRFPELARNRLIVEAVTDSLLAAPHQDKEQRRSGTWATVRAAWAANLPVTILSR